MLNSIKTLLTSTWISIKSVFLNNLQTLKDGLLIFVKTIYTWSVAIIKGVGPITISFLVSLGRIILDGLKILYNKIVTWIKNW